MVQVQKQAAVTLASLVAATKPAEKTVKSGSDILGGQTVTSKRKGAPDEVWTRIASVPIPNGGEFVVYSTGEYKGQQMVAYGPAGTWAGHARRSSAKSLMLLLSVALALRADLGVG